VLSFKDLERPIVDVIQVHGFATPELIETLEAFSVTDAVSLCSINVCVRLLCLPVSSLSEYSA
jgi:hypothetical protein